MIQCNQGTYCSFSKHSYTLTRYVCHPLPYVHYCCFSPTLCTAGTAFLWWTYWKAKANTGHTGDSESAISGCWRQARECILCLWYRCLNPHCKFMWHDTLWMPWSNCYRTATALELTWLRRNVTGRCFSNLYQRAYFAYMNLANHIRCTKLLAHWQWCGRPRRGLGLLQNTQSFCSQSAHTPVYRVCWGIQLLMPPLGNLLTLKSLTFRTSFSVFYCLPVLSIPRAGEAITKTIPRNPRKLSKLMLRKCTFLPPRSHLIGQFVKRHLVTIRKEQHVLAQWLRQYFCQDHGIRSVVAWQLGSFLYFQESS